MTSPERTNSDIINIEATHITNEKKEVRTFITTYDSFHHIFHTILSDNLHCTMTIWSSRYLQTRGQLQDVSVTFSSESRVVFCHCGSKTKVHDTRMTNLTSEAYSALQEIRMIMTEAQTPSIVQLHTLNCRKRQHISCWSGVHDQHAEKQTHQIITDEK